MYCWLKRRGNIWWIYYAKRLNRRPESLGTADRQLAKEVWRRRESDFFCNVHNLPHRPIERITYRELAKKFIESKRATVRTEGTIKEYLRTLNLFGEFIGDDLKAEQITTEMLEGFMRLRGGAPSKSHASAKEELLVSTKTLRNELFVIIGLLHWAKKRKFIIEDPTENLTKPKRVKSSAPRCLSFEDYLRLKKKIASPDFRDILDFYLLTGVRRADGPSVTSENFDFKNMTATLPQNKQLNEKTIPISPWLLQVVQRMIARVGSGQPLVNVSRLNALTEGFQKARDAAGFPKSITFHSLRHSFISWLAATGADFNIIQELAGHGSAEATRHYTHSFAEGKRRAIEKAFPVPVDPSQAGMN